MGIVMGIIFLALMSVLPSFAGIAGNVLPQVGLTNPSGNVKLQTQAITLEEVSKEVTEGDTKDMVIAVLGSPDVVTRDFAGKDTWVYDKASLINSHSKKFFGVGIIAIGYAKAKIDKQGLQKTLVVIIKFDSNNKVESFNYCIK